MVSTAQFAPHLYFILAFVVLVTVCHSNPDATYSGKPEHHSPTHPPSSAGFFLYLINILLGSIYLLLVFCLLIFMFWIWWVYFPPKKTAEQRCIWQAGQIISLMTQHKPSWGVHLKSHQDCAETLHTPRCAGPASRVRSAPLDFRAGRATPQFFRRTKSFSFDITKINRSGPNALDSLLFIFQNVSDVLLVFTEHPGLKNR